LNIKEAKEQIKNAMTAYFTKDDFGGYVIPPEKQRPIFLMGPPGIGKTAIMEQIAQELNVSLVSYSMTHHTRQSALGLPFIVEKNYNGKNYNVSEYTMSEIIASVYDMIEATGNKEGILFLDEINCVSETLSPVMLQFLQYKIFGKHQVPEGWIVVTAGNPPEYNNSVREFDIVTWDRLKRIDVEADYDVWKEYAYKTSVHAVISTYLDIKKGDFYKIESTVDGKSFVTARGWSDLSIMIKLYEKNNIKVDEKLICQYLQNKRIAKDFAIYYDLFNKYKSDYQIDDILNRKANQSICDRAENAKFDERLSLIGLLIEAIGELVKDVYRKEQVLNSFKEIVVNLKASMKSSKVDYVKLIEKQIEKNKQELKKGKQASNLSEDQIFVLNKLISILEEEEKHFIEQKPENEKEGFNILKKDFDVLLKELKKITTQTGKNIENVFNFLEDVFDEGQEILILVTELTISSYASSYISHYGCPAYYKHNDSLLFYERKKEINAALEDLNLEDNE